MAKGRGRLSSIQLLPPECSHVVMWAAAELQESARTQLEIYRDFTTKLEEVQRLSRGEVDFTIPSFSAFNRYSIALDAMTRDLNETREMAAAIAGTLDAKESDDLTIVAVEAVKSLVFTILRTRRGKIDEKGAKALADALRSAAQAQGVSTARLQKVQADTKAAAKAAVAAVVKAKGITEEGAIEILDKFLGVKV